MLHTIADQTQWATVTHQIYRQEVYKRLWLSCLLGAAGLTAAVMAVSGPTPLPLGAGLFLASVAAIFYQPRWGVYFILFFSLISDNVLLFRYPFAKNLSSIESILYIHDALIFSPLELYLVITLAAWLGNALMRRKLNFQAGVLFWPVLLFTLLQLIGLILGLGTGGNLNIALWEVRSIFYMPLMLILISNLIEGRKDVAQLMWVIMAAIFVEGIVGIVVFMIRHHGSLAGVEAITEHAAAIQMNSLFVLALAAWLFGGSAPKRFILPLLIPAVAITYIITQRRAAFVGMGVVLVIMAMLLHKINRKLFWILIPTAALVGLAYLAIFWNSGSALGFAARAVKSIVAPEAGSADESSNLYRLYENINIAYTIHLSPFMGVGYGQKFHIIVPMADISFFVWWEYIVHNSVFWIWMKSGLLGFVSVLFLMGLSLMRGARLLWLIKDGDLQAVAFTATMYLLMHYIYAYVDMSWDAQSMLYIGVALGLIHCLEQIGVMDA